MAATSPPARQLRPSRRGRAGGRRVGGTHRRSSELWQALREADVASGEPPSLNDTQPVVDAALTFIAATPSPLCLLPVEDVMGLEEQPNLPGTINEHPNWRRRLMPEARALLDEPRTARRVAPTGDAAAAVMTAGAQPCGCNCIGNSPLPMRRVWCHTAAKLGISHFYVSPILTARPGSMHGYDVTDPTQVNPELGGEAGLRDMVAALRDAGLGLIVDIVPNHMAAGGLENPVVGRCAASRQRKPLCQLL